MTLSIVFQYYSSSRVALELHKQETTLEFASVVLREMKQKFDHPYRTSSLVIVRRDLAL